ncbi:MAG TPA: hypothetical protein VF608_01705 [Thermoanaerobaculia bacterium]
MRSLHRFSVFAAIAAFVPLLTFAADSEPRGAKLVATPSAIEFQAALDPAPAVLSVQHPDGAVIIEMFAAGENPTLRLKELADGAYSYELRVSQTDGEPLV